MSKLSKEAFAVMAMCGARKLPYGITVDPRNGKLAFCWAFKIDPDKAKREGYDKKTVSGDVIYDEDFPGCPYCGAPGFYLCNACGKIVCYNGERTVTCPNCGNSGTVTEADSFDLSGGGY